MPALLKYHYPNPILLKAIRIFALFILALMLGCNDNKGTEQQPNGESAETASKDTSALRNITFLPYWVTNAQFAGYYVAEEMGIYKKYGIKLKVIQYQPFITSNDLIKEGKADFSALWLANAIELKESGADIVNITQMSSRSSLMMVSKKKRNIKTIKDLNGKKIGIWSGFEVQPKAFFKKYNLKSTLIPVGSTINLFLMDGLDVTHANWFDEYHSIINSGFNPDELNTFFYADYGLNFLEDGIYCLSDKLKKDPQLCKDFVQATLEGWMYAFENPEKALDIVVRIANEAKLPVNRVHQQWMLDRYKDLYIPKGKTTINTSLSEKDYNFVCSVLKESDLIKKIPTFTSFYHPVLKD